MIMIHETTEMIVPTAIAILVIGLVERMTAMTAKESPFKPFGRFAEMFLVCCFVDRFGVHGGVVGEPCI